MDNDVVIKVEGLSKKFCRSLKRSMFYGTLDIARDMLGLPYDKAKLRPAEFFSLENISFEVKKGETFGLVGANGCGKTTLLRLINGIFPLDSGKITTKGRVGALIAVSAGFHPQMTGRENIYLNGTILGMTRKEIDCQFENIVEFADVGDFLDAPVNTYSSGMRVRLGFAIAIHSHPDIVLVDEVLAVGDVQFQRKCLNRISEMREDGVTFILVSHNTRTIESMCNRVLLLDHGKQLMIGTPDMIIPEYELMLMQGKNVAYVSPEPTGVSDNLNRDNSDVALRRLNSTMYDEITVSNVRLVDERGNAKLDLRSRDPLIIEAEFFSDKEIKNAILHVLFIYTEDRINRNRDLISIGTRRNFCIKEGFNSLRIHFGEVNFATGEYKIAFNFFDETFAYPYSKGHYGYFTVKNDYSSLLTAGKYTPLCWVEPRIESEIVANSKQLNI